MFGEQPRAGREPPQREIVPAAKSRFVHYWFLQKRPQNHHQVTHVTAIAENYIAQEVRPENGVAFLQGTRFGTVLVNMEFVHREFARLLVEGKVEPAREQRACPESCEFGPLLTIGVGDIGRAISPSVTTFAVTSYLSTAVQAGPP